MVRGIGDSVDATAIAETGSHLGMWIQLPSGALLNADYIRGIALHRDGGMSKDEWVVNIETGGTLWHSTWFSTYARAKRFLDALQRCLSITPVRVIVGDFDPVSEQTTVEEQSAHVNL